MASVYRHPEEFDPAPESMIFTDGCFDYEATCADEARWTARLAEWCKAQRNGNGDLVGKIIHLPWADGYAQYMIASHKPVSLIHLPLGDAWDVPDYQTRGLRLADLRKMAR